uniref:Secreted protein n=1 Tax=Strongyloides venezuelensis TaxID=75913 RepID=A0A0K0F3K7_STRVS
MVRLFISLFLLANLINYSYSTKDSITDTVNSKLDKVLLEIKDDVNREILEDHDMYIKDKPFIEERIRQNFKVIGLLSSQIINNLRPFLSQVFRPTRIPKGTTNDEYDNGIIGEVKANYVKVSIYDLNMIEDAKYFI